MGSSPLTNQVRGQSDSESKVWLSAASQSLRFSQGLPVEPVVPLAAPKHGSSVKYVKLVKGVKFLRRPFRVVIFNILLDYSTQPFLT